MRMTEIVSFLDLSVYPSIALIFFLAAFIAILWKTLSKSQQETDAAANIPLDDDVIFTPRASINTDSQSTTDKGATHA